MQLLCAQVAMAFTQRECKNQSVALCKCKVGEYWYV